jgi:hypothetical protein
MWRWCLGVSLPIRAERYENAGKLVETLDADLGPPVTLAQ